MPNRKQTSGEFQGQSFLYSNLDKDRMQLLLSPFQPVFQTEEQVEGEDPTPPQVKFIQAYIINYLSQPEDYFFIEGMDKAFDLDINLPAEDPFERVYEVKITLNETNGTIKNAKFQKKPVEGEEGYRDPLEEFNVYNASTSFPISDCVEVFFPVCKFLNDNLDELWLNENIHWWGDLLAACTMWSPTITNIGTPEAPIFGLYFGDGIINNIKTKKPITSLILDETDYEEVRYIVLNVDINGDGTINPATLTQELKTEDELVGLALDPVLEDAVPTNIKIILGSISQGLVCLNFKGKIQIEPYIWFTKDKEAEEFKFGLNPYIQYWKIRVS